MKQAGKSVQDQTAADTKSIGFDYQYYYFLYRMVQLEKGQTVGYEVKDDVHIDKENGDSVLIQLKHSLDSKANLTEKDDDLWKTIANWTKLINDGAQNRSNLDEQLEYIKKTSFLLVTNKSSTKTNKFLQYIKAFNEGNKELSDIKSYLIKISAPKKGKSPSVVDGYIILLLSQDDIWLDGFFNKMGFLLSKDSLIESIKTKIKGKNIIENRVDDVYESIDSNLRTFIYDEVKAGKKININFDLYYKKFTKYYEMGRRKGLLIRSQDTGVPVPSNPMDYISIKQLIDTEIMDENDLDFNEEIIRIFTDKLLMNNNEKRWLQDSEITNQDINNFNKRTIRKWKNNFDKIHALLKKELRTTNLIDVDKEKLNILALECYQEILSLNLTLDETDLELELSNGKFYILSDQPEIGWAYDWRERYKV